MKPASIVKLVTGNAGEQIQGCHALPFAKRAKLGMERFPALGVCGFIEGVLQVIPVAGNFTADIVVETIEQQILPLLPRNVFLVADNASVHDEPRQF